MCQFHLPQVAFVIMATLISRRVLGLSTRAVATRRSVFMQGTRTSRFSTTTTLRASYEVDADEESEQHLADRAAVKGTHINVPIRNSRYSSALHAVGLDPGLLDQLPSLTQERVVSPNDVFCNRELKMSGIRAIGFDMDYTLAQYKQPAFDRLAFDGAVEKLVYKLGYPKEVLDFEYDHTVSDPRHIGLLCLTIQTDYFACPAAMDSRFDY